MPREVYLRHSHRKILTRALSIVLFSCSKKDEVQNPKAQPFASKIHFPIQMK